MDPKAHPIDLCMTVLHLTYNWVYAHQQLQAAGILDSEELPSGLLTAVIYRLGRSLRHEYSFHSRVFGRDTLAKVRFSRDLLEPLMRVVPVGNTLHWIALHDVLSRMSPESTTTDADSIILSLPTRPLHHALFVSSPAPIPPPPIGELGELLPEQTADPAGTDMSPLLFDPLPNFTPVIPERVLSTSAHFPVVPSFPYVPPAVWPNQTYALLPIPLPSSATIYQPESERQPTRPPGRSQSIHFDLMKVFNPATASDPDGKPDEPPAVLAELSIPSEMWRNCMQVRRTTSSATAIRQHTDTFTGHSSQLGTMRPIRPGAPGYSRMEQLLGLARREARSYSRRAFHGRRTTR